MLSGPPGLGKTTLAHVIAKHAGYNVVEINARWEIADNDDDQPKCFLPAVNSGATACYDSDDRSADVFQKRIDTATQMKSVLGSNEKPNCLIIDEIDGAPSVHSRANN